MTRPIGVRELEALFFGRHPGPHIIVMIRAAFDASMEDPHGITAVAGYIGSADEWLAVEEKWNNQLALLGMLKYRFSDVFRRGKAAALRRTLPFAHIISRSKLRNISAFMLDTDWSLLDKDSEYLRIYPRRQHACLDMILGPLAEEIDLHYKGLPVAVTFDNDYDNTEMATRVYEAWRTRTGHPGFGTIAFTKGTAEWDVVPLQCADLLAGSIRRDPSSKEHLMKPFSGPQRYSTGLSISTIRMKAMANGRGAQWSIALAREIEVIRKKRRDSGEE